MHARGTAGDDGRHLRHDQLCPREDTAGHQFERPTCKHTDTQRKGVALMALINPNGPPAHT